MFEHKSGVVRVFNRRAGRVLNQLDVRYCMNQRQEVKMYGFARDNICYRIIERLKG